jgi:hypothetical protein
MFEFITDYFKFTKKSEDNKKEDISNKVSSKYNDDQLNIMIGAATLLSITGYLFYKKK